MTYEIKGATFHLLDLELHRCDTNHYQICGTKRTHGQHLCVSVYIAAAILNVLKEFGS